MDDTPTETTAQSDGIASSESAADESRSTQTEPLFRREVLAAGAATGAAALGVGVGSTGAQSDADFDGWFDTTQAGHPVSNFQYNPNRWSGTTHIEYSLWAQYAHFDWKTGEFVPHLVQSWEFGESEAVLTLREDFTWSDGSDLTAQDLLEQWRVYELTEHPLFDVAEAVEATGEYELTVSYPEGTNTDVVRHAILHAKADMPPQDWSDFAEGDGLTNHEVSEPTASGPVELTEQTENYHQFEPREDHPYGPNIDWNGYRMRHHDGNQAIQQALIDQEVDGIHSLFVGGQTLEKFPDGVEEITFPGVFGLGMWFNHDRDPWTNRAVRQAVHYSLDMEPILRALGQSAKIYHPTQTGLTDVAVQEEFGGYDIEGFNAYEQNAERAQQLVSDAGYTIGEIQPSYVVPAGWSDWVLMSSLIGEHMRQVGWDVSVDQRGREYWNARGNGDFDIIAGPHKNSSQHNNPYFALRFQLYGESGSPADFSNYAPTDGTRTVTVDGEEIDIGDAFERLASTQDEATQTELTTKLAKVVNRDVPYVHVAQKYEQSFIDRSKWAFPDDHPLLYTQWPMNNLPKTDERLDDHLEDAPAVDAPGLLKADPGQDEERVAHFGVQVAVPSEVTAGEEAPLDVMVTNEGDAPGDAEVAVEYEDLTESVTVSLEPGEFWSSTYSLATESPGDVSWSVSTQHDAESGTLTVEQSDTTRATVGDETVCDVDGDGTFADVDCDGRVAHADVQKFFRHQHRPAWKQPDMFDFDGNERVGHGDVVELFRTVASQPLE